MTPKKPKTSTINDIAVVAGKEWKCDRCWKPHPPDERAFRMTNRRSNWVLCRSCIEKAVTKIAKRGAELLGVKL